MKDLLVQALNEAFDILEKRIPQTKKKTECISILDVKPVDLITFMKDNNIPYDADFSGRDNGYDAWDDIQLCWDIDAPTTEKDKLDFKKKNFTTICFERVYSLLTNNGYKRVGFNTGLLKAFDDTTVYDMYIHKDINRLVEYYTLYFVKQ